MARYQRAIGSHQYVRKWLGNKVLELEDEFQEVSTYPDLQGRWLLISHVLSAKVTHLYRSLALKDSLWIGYEHDALMMRAMNSLIGCQLDCNAVKQLIEGRFRGPLLSAVCGSSSTRFKNNILSISA